MVLRPFASNWPWDIYLKCRNLDLSLMNQILYRQGPKQTIIIIIDRKVICKVIKGHKRYQVSKYWVLSIFASLFALCPFAPSGFFQYFFIFAFWEECVQHFHTVAQITGHDSKCYLPPRSSIYNLVYVKP